jgi:hypothetical protein
VYLSVGAEAELDRVAREAAVPGEDDVVAGAR